MKVYIPENIDMSMVDDLSIGKEYDLKGGASGIGTIKDDEGREIIIICEEKEHEHGITCSHLNGQAAWKVAKS